MFSKGLIFVHGGLGTILCAAILVLAFSRSANGQSYQIGLDGEISYQYLMEFDVPTDSFSLAAKSWLNKQKESNETILVTTKDSIARFTMETYRNINMRAKTKRGTPKSADTLTRIWFKLRIYIKQNKCKMVISDFRTGRHGDNKLSERLIFPRSNDVYRYEWLATLEDLKDSLFKRFKADVKSRSAVMKSEWEF